MRYGIGASILTWCIILGMVTGVEAEPPRPNIVFFYADDLGYGDLACYGNKQAITSNLDRLAEQGTRFTQFYVSHCVCSPTRTSAITGQFPSRHRIYGPLGFFEKNRKWHMPDWLDVNAPSFPRALQGAGYRTAMIGKWHLGGGSGSTFKITDLKTPGIDTSGRTEIVVNHPDAPPVLEYGFHHARTTVGNSPTWKEGELWPKPHDMYPYSDQEWLRWSSRSVADEAIGFLDEHVAENKEAPFYMNVWFKDVHTPFNPTDEMLELFQDLPEKPRVHYAMLKFMDEQIGRVLKTLDSHGLGHNTLVVFSSDNGAGKGRGGSNAPFRGWKHSLNEGGIRVPLILRWPAGGVEAGRVDETSVLNICDFVPTFSKLAGAKMPEGYESDGEDFSTAMQGGSFVRSKDQFWYYPITPMPLAMRSENWKYLCKLGGEDAQLYDLARDPGEANNLAEAHPGIAERMGKLLMDWYSETPVARELSR